MSLEHQMPVLMKKTQMSGDRAGTGSQCGLTSLLPMSCRGRAAAFARDLNSRLRNLGAAQEHECENTWLTRDSTSTHRPATSPQRDLETFYDFELECESPSSPVDEYDAPFPERSTTDITETPFFDVNSEVDLKEKSRLTLKQPDKNKNGFKFSTAFYTDTSPVKLQPVPRENGYADKPLYSPISFEGCVRQNSWDEIDFATRSPTIVESARFFSSPINKLTVPDSDSEFESAKSEPSDCNDDITLGENSLGKDATEGVENLSLTDADLFDEEIAIDSTDIKSTSANNIDINATEIITSEVSDEKDVSPVPEIDPKLLNTECKEDEETEDDRPQRVRRCSSLKTGKTPPGTPGRKKIVRFADVLGLDLADVKTFMDEIPVIPKSAYDDLTGCDVQNSPPARPQPKLGALTLVPLFQLPRDVTEKLEKMNVCLESARVCDGAHVTVCGSVRVRNLDFHKTVHVRYTMNRWKTYTDLQATYVQGSCDGYSDRFQFVLYAPCISSGQRLELAVRFQCKGQQFWDSNDGSNYCFDCLALGATAPISATPIVLHPTVDWHPSFY
ncbi:unnamed protein product [Parnassius apollo]|uniref:(apollo) hypothetical protein n=1 Tax=Parnassius apollo TaxID=110799 RepID=A0A8S3W9K8_PARAO|nr:unnamed protein product [Parnassius apollo]